MENNITFFGETNFRNQKRRFGIKQHDRGKHMYIIGKTGMGKTTLLENIAIQDIKNGNGLGIVDPHGEFAEKMIDHVPPSRINDVIYFDPSDLEFPIAFNVIEKVNLEYRHLVASGIMGVFKKIWPDVWSPRMEYILSNSVLALLEYPGSTLLGINRMLADKDYRNKVVERITDSSVKSFWINEFAKYPDRFREEAVAPIQNKVGQFISVPLIRNIVGQSTSSIDMRKVMDEGKILIMNLSKGKIGEDASRLIGALLITKLQLAAMSRVDVPEEDRRDFYLYVDEFQNFATESFVNILSEARKYHLSLILAHQYITQMEEVVRDAIFGNVGSLLSFRVGAVDAEFLEKEFLPEFSAGDVVNLGFANIYLKLMIDGVASRPFSALTLPPILKPQESYREKIIRISREHYGTSREEVEEKIARWSGVIEVQKAGGGVDKNYSSAVLYDAECSKCGSKTKVVFEPDGKRPVYCKKCLSKIKENQAIPIKVTESEPVSNIQKEKSISLESLRKEESELSPHKPEKERKKIEFEKRERKKVDVDGLRKALAESLEGIDKKDEEIEKH